MARIKGSKNKTTKHLMTSTSYSTVNEMAEDVRSVLKSIIKQDGRFTTREAGVVGKLYGAELSRMKMQVDIHKINSRISSKQTTADQVLTLT